MCSDPPCLTTPYCEWIDDSERRHKAGQRQVYCGECGGLWVWPDQCSHFGRLTRLEFNALVRRVVRRYPVGKGEQQYQTAVRRALAEVEKGVTE